MMVEFITLTHVGGRRIPVNPAAIAYLDSAPPHTLVCFSAGRQLVVEETQDEIRRLCADVGRPADAPAPAPSPLPVPAEAPAASAASCASDTSGPSRTASRGKRR